MVERLERNFISENAAEDDTPCALRKEECEFTSCDSGISYPVFQAADHRDRIRTRLMVPHNSTQFHTIPHNSTFYVGLRKARNWILQGQSVPL